MPFVVLGEDRDVQKALEEAREYLKQRPAPPPAPPVELTPQLSDTRKVPYKEPPDAMKGLQEVAGAAMNAMVGIHDEYLSLFQRGVSPFPDRNAVLTHLKDQLYRVNRMAEELNYKLRGAASQLQQQKQQTLEYANEHLEVNREILKKGKA